MAAVIAAAMITPVIWLLRDALGEGTGALVRSWNGELPGLLGRSVLLTGMVSLLSIVLGGALAFLVVRTDMPLRAVVFWLSALPLAMPSFVAAIAYADLLGPGGRADRAVGYSGIFGVEGATLVLTLTLFPYVFLVAAAALRVASPEQEEAARSLGCGPLATALRVTLPGVRTALAAGGVLVAFHVLAEYPTVALMRYDTFAREIFVQLAAFSLDRSAAAVLSLVLVLITALVILGEGRLSSAFRPSPSSRRPTPVALGAMRWPALGICLGCAVAAVGVPLAWLVHMAGWGPPTPEGFATGFASLSGETLSDFVANSLLVAGGAAILCVVLGLPVAVLAARHRGPTVAALSVVTQGGYAIPGVVVALILIGLVAGPLTVLAGSVWLIVIGHVVRLLPEAAQASRGSLTRVSPALEEAARSLGRGPLRAFVGTTLPIASGGVIAGGMLVFLSAMKEVPATLLLRPAGFDTLAVRVWIDASEGLYRAAAPGALWLVGLCALSLVIALLLTSARWARG